MKTHTNNFKNEVKKFGRQIDSKITYTIDNEEIELGAEQLNSITPHYEGGILKSVMRQLDIDSNVEIPLETILTYEFGVKVGSEYEYINFGNYIVYSSEKQEDTNSWKIVCYDKMLYSMKNYEAMNITYPITIRNYISAICTHLGLTFKNASDTFANYDKVIPNELYLDADGNSLDYTFRDVLDQLAEVTASTICINENDDELEIRYINNTNDTIDEEYLKDVNVNFGEKFGPVNTIVLSRSAGADNIYYPSVLPENPCEIKISDNLIMNDNNRDTYMPDIYNQLNGLEYYINDFSSTGITYYDLCDRYSVQIGENTYSCVMFNDEVNVTQGLEESVYTDFPEDGETDYKKADKTDRKINQTTLIVDKQNKQIQALITSVEENSEKIDGLEPTQEATGIEELYLPNSAGKDLIEYRLKGKSEQKTTTGKNLFIQGDTITNNGITYTKNDDGSYNINGTASPQANYYFNTSINDTKLISGQTYTLSSNKTFPSSMTIIVEAYNGNTWLRNLIRLNNGQTSSTATIDLTNATRIRQTIRVYDGREIAIDNLQIMLEEGSQATSYEQYTDGISPNPNYPQNIKSIGDIRNLFDKDNANTLDAYFNKTNTSIISSSNTKTIYIPCLPNTTYTISKISSLRFFVGYTDIIPDIGVSVLGIIGNTTGDTTYTIKTGTNAKYLVAFVYITSDTLTEQEILDSIQIEEGLGTDYIPHGNYIDVVNRNENLFNYKDTNTVTQGILIDEDGWITITYDNSSGSATKYFQYYTNNLNLKTDTDYNVITEIKTVSGTGILYPATFYSTSQVTNTITYNFNILSNNEIKSNIIRTKTDFSNVNQGLRTVIRFDAGQSGTVTFRLSVLEDTTITANSFTYIPYELIHNYINLTQPLPSLPDGTADELIVKDGKAKIIQNVGRIVLDGSEEGWTNREVNTNTYRVSIDNIISSIGKSECVCNYFMWYSNMASNSNFNSTDREAIHIRDNGTGFGLRIDKNIASTVAQLKTWLDTHNILVQYPLANPVEIDLGEVSIKTINGNDYLYITDPIKSDMYAKYIRNTDFNDVFYNKTETKTEIKVVKDEIDLAVDRIDDLTPYIDTKTGTNYIHLEKTFASEGAINSLSIKGFTLIPLYPGMSYPSDTQYPGANSCYKLYFDTIYPVSSTKQTIEIISPIPLQTATISGETVQDELLIENNKIYVIQNLGYNSSNQLIKLSESITHDVGEIPIPTLPYDTYITVENYNNDTLLFECEYLQSNPYTDIFATQSEMSSKFSITDSNINSKVSKNNIISEINQSAEEVTIDASKITLSGYTSINDSFSVDEQGNFSVESPSSGIYDYNIFDLRAVFAIMQDKINVDAALLNILDTDETGQINSVDYVKIYKYLDGTGTLEKNVTSSFEFDPTNPKYCIAVKNSGLITASMGSGGINANVANVENLICCKAGNSTSMVNDPLITMNGSTGEIFVNKGQKHSKIKYDEIIVEDTSGYQTISTITPNGIVTPTVTQTSLEENKKNFEIFNNALEIIDDIDLYKYNLITENDNHKKHIGFVIGKNYKYSSEITAVDNEGKEIGVDNYSMTSLCLQAIKEQQEIIKQLQNEIKDLKERIDK